MNIENILHGINSLPPMPAVAMKILEFMNNPNADMGALSDLINKDPAMTANLLKLCNSSFYGFSKEITSVKQAVGLLGYKKISQIAMTLISSRYLSGKQEGYGLQAGALWRNSIITAITAENIAVAVKYPDPGTAFTAGLLQNIGKTIISTYVGEHVAEIQRLVTEQKLSFDEAEKQVLGFTHSDAGYMLLARWNFPAVLTEAVHFHHDSSKAKLDPKLTAICQMADGITMMMGIGIGVDGLSYNIPENVTNTLGITDQSQIEKLMISVSDQITKTPDILKVPK